MSSIKVVDVNNEEAKQEEAIEQPIEEVKEEVNEIVEEPPQETAIGSLNSNTKEVIEETQEQDTKPNVKTQDTKPSVKAQDAKPCVKAQDKLVRCPKCSREMKLKNYRYGHQQRCQGGIENKPVKPHTKARAKPKQLSQSESSLGQSPKPQPIIQDVEEEVPQLTQPVKKQILKPTNPLADITNHYQLLQQQYIQQKQAKYQNLCQNMFSSKTKMKR